MPVISTLDDVFAPLSSASFFAEHYEKAPLHLCAPPNVDRTLLTHDDLFLALFALNEAPAGLLVFPEYLGATKEALLTDASLLAAYLAAGHPIVWNRARGVSAAIDAVSALLAETFGAAVWPNIYSTGTAGTPFEAHFDAHEVIAIQCEGDKDWWISDVRVDRPLDAPEMEAAVFAALTHKRDNALRRTLTEFRAKPSDVVYIPRGQFHNAKAAGGRSLHVTFGIRSPSTFEVAREHLLELLSDSLMREFLPALDADPNGAKTKALVDEVADRLQVEFQPLKLLETARRVAADWARPKR